MCEKKFFNCPVANGMLTGLKDIHGTDIRFGDTVRLTFSDGETRDFTVSYKTVERVVQSPEDFGGEFTKVAITGVVFTWEGYDLFPCVNEDGKADNETMMEVIKEGAALNE